MKQVREAWFEFKGVRSDRMGVEMLERPRRETPAAKGESCAVSGRSGRLWIDDGAWENVSVEMACAVPDGQMDDVLAWLTGMGELRFSDEPDRVYRARVRGGMWRTMPFARLSAQKFELSFDCEPFRYLYPAAEAIVLTEPGVIENPGTAPAQPRLMIEGSGSFVVTVNGCMMEFEGVEGGIVVDCGQMDCLSLDGAQLLNGCVGMAEFPVLRPGQNSVSWTGNVEKITVEPRWRFI